MGAYGGSGRIELLDRCYGINRKLTRKIVTVAYFNIALGERTPYNAGIRDAYR
jgi:hypothetical protein